MDPTYTHLKQSQAHWPWKFSWADWWAVIKRSWHLGRVDNISVISAGVAFFSLLAIFPLITAALSIFSYFTDASDVAGIVQSLASFLPGEAHIIIEDQVTSVLNADTSKLEIGIFISLGIAFFSAGAGIRSMMRTMNVVYHERETRGFFTFYAYAALMTLGSLIFIWGALLVILGIPSALNFFNLNGQTKSVTRFLPWVLIIIIFFIGCGTMYRFGPSRRPARKRWIFPGIIFSLFGWLLISYGFSVFVARFGNYNEIFGGLASVIVLLIWLWLSANVVIMGAKLNAELECQTIADTTRGPDLPLGERGAVVADFLAEDTSLELARQLMPEELQTE